MEDSTGSDSSIADLLSEDATASLQLAQEGPSLQVDEASEAHQTAVSVEDDESCEEVESAESRSRFNAATDKSLLAEVLSTPPFDAGRKAVTGVWKEIASRLNLSTSSNFSFRSCRDRATLLLRKYAVRKKRNESASGTGEVHTDEDDILEQLQQLKDVASTQAKVRMSSTTLKGQEVETAGQQLMKAAEERVVRRLTSGEAGSASKPKRRRLSALLESEQEEALERWKLEEQKLELQREELVLRRDELEQQRCHHELLREQLRNQTTQTETILKLLAAAISKSDN